MSQKSVIKFEKNFGSIILLKIGMSTINDILIDHGIIAKHDLIKKFEEKIKIFEKNENKKKLKQVKKT